MIQGAGNYMTALISRFSTRELTAKISARLMKPRAPELKAGSPAH